MKRENGTGSIFDIFVIGKASKFISSFVGEADFIIVFNPLECTVCISRRLRFYSSDIFTSITFLGLNNAYRCAVYKKSIINRSCTCRKLSHSDT